MPLAGLDHHVNQTHGATSALCRLETSLRVERTSYTVPPILVVYLAAVGKIDEINPI